MSWAFFFTILLPIILVTAWGNYEFRQWQKAVEADKQRRIEAYIRGDL